MQYTGCRISFCCWIAALAISTAQAGVDQFRPRSPSAAGHPQIQFNDSTSTAATAFVVERGVAGNVGACLDTLNETRSYDAAAGITWCTRTVALPGNAAYGLQQNGTQWIYTDKLVRIDEVDTAEYKYRVKTQGDTAGKEGWTASCAIDASDPLAAWVTEFHNRIGANQALFGVNDIPTPNAVNPGKPVLHTVSASYNGSANTNFYLYANDKYVAVFGPRGTLLGLTHRALGQEFITYRTGDDNANLLVHPLTSGGEWMWLLKMSNSTANYAPGSTCPSQSASGVTLLYSLSGSVAVPTIDGDGKLTFTWSALPGFTGTVNTEWTLPSIDSPAGASAGLRGRLIVGGTLNNQNSLYLCGTFPRISGLGLQLASDPAVIDVVWPGGVGGPNNSGRLISGYSQSNSNSYGELHSGLQLQFTGILNGAHGLYIATEDSASQPKRYYFNNYFIDANNGNKSRAGSSYVEFYPLDASNTLAPAYDTVLRPMCGGWERMAKQYRHWALEQAWVAGNGKTADRTDIAQSVRDGLYWWTANLGATNTPYDLEDYVQISADNLKSEIGQTSTGGSVPIGIHLYQWYQEVFDRYVPQFTTKIAPVSPPNSPDMNAVLSNIRADNTVVVPYINMSSIDITNRSSPNYGSRGCPPAAHGWWGASFTYGPLNNVDLLTLATQLPATANGEDYWVNCYSGALSVHANADLSQSQWQDVVAFNVDKVFDLGVDGVYLDTYGSGYKPDYSAAHGHGGHGHWWLDGAVAIGTGTVLRAQNGGSGVRGVVGAEFFDEALMPYTDILMNYVKPQLADVPLLWSVYSGYQIYAGGTPAAAQSNAARTAILGRDFVWGYQLGLATPTGLCGSSNGRCSPSHSVVSYARTLAQARNTAFLRQYLSYGELLQMADDVATGSGHVVSYTSAGAGLWCNQCDGTAAAVRGARWRINGGAEIILVTNTTTTSVTASIRQPSTWDDAELCNADGSSNCSTISAVNGEFSFSVIGHGVRVLKKL